MLLLEERELENIETFIPEAIFELSYRDIKRRAEHKVVRRAIPLRSWLTTVRKNGDLVFNTISGTHPPRRWTQFIKFKDLKIILKNSSGAAEIRKKLLAADIIVHCNCPAYKYWGYQYIATKNSYAIIPETRFPQMRNPLLKGSVCKHVYSVLQVLPKYMPNIIRRYKKYGLGG